MTKKIISNLNNNLIELNADNLVQNEQMEGVLAVFQGHENIEPCLILLALLIECDQHHK